MCFFHHSVIEWESSTSERYNNSLPTLKKALPFQQRKTVRKCRTCSTVREAHPPPPPPKFFFKYLLVNLILQIEVLCPYNLQNGAFLNLKFWPVRQEHTYAVWTVHCLNREKFAIGVKTMCCHNYGSSNFIFGIDLHFHPGGLWGRQLFLLFFYLLLKTLLLDIRKCSAVEEYQIVSLKDRGSCPGNVF